jgi:S1 RNA binding domain protein
MLAEVGTVVEGKVVSITSFGAFVQLQDGRTGLVHISEVADEYVKDVRNHIQEGQTVKVRVISSDKEGKISLSIKKAAEKTARPKVEWSKDNGNDKSSFEDRLSKFLKDSDEKMADLKKNFEAKRGSGKYKKSAN